MRITRIFIVVVIGLQIFFACSKLEPAVPATQPSPPEPSMLPVVPPPVPITTMPQVPGNYEVRIPGWEFIPSSITVPTGSTVSWINTDSIVHSVKSVDGLFNESLTPGKSFSYTFNKPGTFSYYCEDHDGNASESGTVVVQ